MGFLGDAEQTGMYEASMKWRGMTGVMPKLLMLMAEAQAGDTGEWMRWPSCFGSRAKVVSREGHESPGEAQDIMCRADPRPKGCFFPFRCP